MVATIMNALALRDIFESKGVATRCLSNIFADQVAEAYSYRRATKHLESGRVIIVAGGIGRPYFTHDTAAVNVALELNCQIMLKATKVDGVFTKDPNKHSDARKIAHLSFQEAVENPNVAVMDKAALGLAMEQHMPILVFDAMRSGNISKVIQGKAVGTSIGD